MGWFGKKGVVGTKSHKFDKRQSRGGAYAQRTPKLFGRSNVLPNVVTSAKFGFDRLTRFCFTGVEIHVFPILSRTAHTTVLCTNVQRCDEKVMAVTTARNVGVAFQETRLVTSRPAE